MELMNLLADGIQSPVAVETHCHTSVSAHAYSTLMENVMVAAARGMKGLCVTDHAPELFDGAPVYYFENLKSLPDQMMGVRLYRGAELNLMSAAGRVDLPDGLLSRLDWVIASIHLPEFSPGDREAVNAAYQNLAKNPFVDVIGHCGRGKFFFDWEPVIKAFAGHGKVVEVNELSARAVPESVERCAGILALCKQYEVPVVLCADAHFADAIGRYDHALSLVEQVGYPKDRILNLDGERFEAYVQERRREKQRHIR